MLCKFISLRKSSNQSFDPRTSLLLPVLVEAGASGRHTRLNIGQEEFLLLKRTATELSKINNYNKLGL